MKGVWRGMRSTWHADLFPHDRMRSGRVYDRNELSRLFDLKALSAEQSPFNGVFDTSAGDIRYLRVRDSDLSDAGLVIAGHSSFTAADSALLSRLTPHIKLASRSYLELEQERARSSISAHAMERLNFGWLTLDEHCRILDVSENIEAHVPQDQSDRSKLAWLSNIQLCQSRKTDPGGGQEPIDRTSNAFQRRESVS